ncbi:Inorganic pyrophosphatase [Exophiala xenobiotica]|nr:Inorganic pyrophosphatase [Exophiala xenobiotica]KAK5345787.1 Inorganic pyrophosphatase [Exophiala xenobiotica]
MSAKLFSMDADPFKTWEDPSHVYSETGLPGDNDPLDACEIGEAVAYTGQVKQVKVLGLMALLDEGETDFKIIVIDVKDPLASQMADISDVMEQMPGLLEATRDWFRLYKCPAGSEPNQIGLGGGFKNKK